MRGVQRGFMLLTTIVFLALMSALALMMLGTASMDGVRAVGDTVTSNAAYAAEAGLAHARWTLAQHGSCSGYPDLPDTAFGNGGYSAKLSGTSGTPVSVTAVGWLDDGSRATRSVSNVAMYAPTGPSALTLQPGAAGVDTYIGAGTDRNLNFGASTVLAVSNTGTPRMALLRFDLGALPAAAQIVSAELALYLTGTGVVVDGVLDLHRPLRSWFEGEESGTQPTVPGATFQRYDGTSLLAAWSVTGTQYDPTVLSSQSLAGLNVGWVSWDVTALAGGGAGSMLANRGVLLRASAGTVDSIAFVSSDGDPALAPKLTINYRCECGNVCSAIAPLTEPLLLSTAASAEIGGLSMVSEDLADYDPVADLATLALDGAAAGLGDSIDALHLLANGHVVLSTDADTTFAGLTFTDADLVDYDPVSNSATIFLDAATHFQVAQNVTSLYLRDNGNIVLSTDAPARLGNVDFSPRDLIEYDRTTRTASVLFDGDATTLSEHITALHVLPSGQLVLAAADATTLGGVSFDTDQLVAYDPVGGGAALYFDGKSRFADDGEQFDALHVGAGSGSGAGPVAHWKLDETGGLTASDAVGGHDGTLSGTTTWTSGEIDNALDFGPGVVTVAHSDALSLTGMMTISTWFRADNLVFGYRAMVSKEASPDTNNYWFGLFGTQLVFGFWGGTAWDLVLTPALTLSPGNWYHAAATYDASTGESRIYLDGAQVFSGTLTATPQASVSPIRLGNSSVGEAWRGALDDVRIYDVALGADDIAALAGIAPPGGGGPGSCAETFADNFDSRRYDNNDGSQSWSSDWLEINESDGPTSGDERVDSADSNFHLRIADNDGGGEGLQREADLSAYATATLTFDYRRRSFDNANDYVTLDVSSDGGANWTELDRFAGGATDSGYLPASYDIGGFISAATRIRFLGSPDLGATDRFYVDNVRIAVTCPP